MQRMRQTCGSCSGLGYYTKYEQCSDNMFIQTGKVACDQCGGNGYTEYVVFSVEEAEAILKHCGLTTES